MLYFILIVILAVNSIFEDPLDQDYLAPEHSLPEDFPSQLENSSNENYFDPEDSLPEDFPSQPEESETLLEDHPTELLSTVSSKFLLMNIIYISPRSTILHFSN